MSFYECYNFVSDRQNWTVHGIWPSKNHKMGPFHCNNSAKFSDEAIKPILEDLKLHWTNVRHNTPLGNISYFEEY